MWSLIGDKAGLPLVSPHISRHLRKGHTRYIMLRNVTKQSRIKVICSLAEKWYAFWFCLKPPQLCHHHPCLGLQHDMVNKSFTTKRVGNLTYYPCTLGKVKITWFQASLILADIKKSLGPCIRWVSCVYVCMYQCAQIYHAVVMVMMIDVKAVKIDIVDASSDRIYILHFIYNPPFLPHPCSPQIWFWESFSCVPLELNIW